MSLLNTIFQQIKEHPSASGLKAWAVTLFINIMGVLSQDETVKFIGSLGGILGIVLTTLTIYYKVKNEQKPKP